MARQTQSPKSGILWEGASLIDGSPIVAIATTESSNIKTRDMVQTWILRADMLATDAIHSGADVSICGDCPMRGEIVDGRNRKRKCYVKVFHAPRTVSAKYLMLPYKDARGVTRRRKEGYAYVDPRTMGRGRKVRIGSYGDPMAVPAHVWRALLAESIGHTGYTHQWDNPDRDDVSDYAFLMVSADNPEDYDRAQRKGLRAFRSKRSMDPVLLGEIVCPASAEAGHKSTCDRCGLCSGVPDDAADRRYPIPSIVIDLHGIGAKH